MALETFGFCKTQATESWDIVKPARSAIGFSFWTAVKTSSFIHLEIIPAPPFLSVAREPAGGFFPGKYFPVKMPWAIGDQTIWPMPSFCESGTTSASITRHNAEY